MITLSTKIFLLSKNILTEGKGIEPSAVAGRAFKAHYPHGCYLPKYQTHLSIVVTRGLPGYNKSFQAYFGGYTAPICLGLTSSLRLALAESRGFEPLLPFKGRSLISNQVQYQALPTLQKSMNQ